MAIDRGGRGNRIGRRAGGHNREPAGSSKHRASKASRREPRVRAAAKRRVGRRCRRPIGSVHRRNPERYRRLPCHLAEISPTAGTLGAKSRGLRCDRATARRQPCRLGQTAATASAAFSSVKAMSCAVCATEMEHCLVAMGTKNTPSSISARRNARSRSKS